MHDIFQGSVLSRLDRDSRLGRMALLGGCHVAGHVADGARAGFCCGLGPSDTRVGPFGDSRETGAPLRLCRARLSQADVWKRHRVASACAPEWVTRRASRDSQFDLLIGPPPPRGFNFSRPSFGLVGWRGRLRVKVPQKDIFLGSVLRRLDRDSWLVVFGPSGRWPRR